MAEPNEDQSKQEKEEEAELEPPVPPKDLARRLHEAHEVFCMVDMQSAHIRNRRTAT